MISIKVDTKAVQSMLKTVQKQIPYTIATAINATVRQAAADANSAMPSVFAHTNAFTRMAVGTSILATKSSLTGVVAIKPLQARYLSLEVTGGVRTPAMNTRLPSAALVLPGKGPDPLPAGSIKRLAAQAQADQARRQAVAAGVRRRGKSTGADVGVFKTSGAGPHGVGPGGFFRRLPGHHLTRLVAFEPTANYRPKFQFERQITQTVNSTFAANVNRALTRALATAK